MSDLFDLPFEEDPEPGPQHPADNAVSTPPADVHRASPADPPLDAGKMGPSDPPQRRVYSVTDVTVAIRDLLEDRFLEVWIEGELSNCKVWNNGHLYFTLKDDRSQLRGFMFKSALRYLKFRPVDGTHVVARGKITVYEPKGEYQLVCDHLEPKGLGALQLAFEQLKQRLQKEGLFDVSRKRPLPALPRKIGIVTSLDGAAIRDIIKVLARRYANAHLVVCPARVQGADAAADVARALRQIGRVSGVDVVIVGRGGGSIEDLWAFNEEMVARAIARVPVPVIAAVGHETDVTIADFVADVRAPTPSAAAEMVVARKDEFCGRIDRLHDRLHAAARARVQMLSRRVHIVDGRPALAGFPGRLAMRARHAAELSYALARALRERVAARARRMHQAERQLNAFDPGRCLGGLQTRLVAADGRLRGAAARRQDRASAQLRACIGRLESLSPLAVLGRGYAVAWNADKTGVLRDAASVAAGDRIRVTLARGELGCTVHSTADTPPESARRGPT